MKIKDLFREVKYPIKLYDKNGNQIYCEDSIRESKSTTPMETESDSNIYYESITSYVAQNQIWQAITKE